MQFGTDRPLDRLWRLVALLMLGAALVHATGGAVRAHELRPSIVDLTITPAGDVTAEISLNLEAFMAGISGAHDDTRDAPEAAAYDALRALDAPALEGAFRARAPDLLRAVGLATGGATAPLAPGGVTIASAAPDLPRVSRLTLSGTIPASVQAAIWRDGGAFGDVVLRVRTERAAAPYHTQFVQTGAAADPIPLTSAGPESAWASFARYVPVGFDHILPKGLDHILFVLGLFLLSPRVRPLLAQVTMFTLAHSVTLALGLYGVVRIAPEIVEPLIAASIVFIAAENLVTDRLSRWRPFVVFAFGLLHGLGFAGVLAEFGLPEGHYLPALIGFNLGVEIGQLTVIALAFLSVGLWFRHRDWYRRAVTMPASVLVAAVGAFWVVERIA